MPKKDEAIAYGALGGAVFGPIGGALGSVIGGAFGDDDREKDRINAYYARIAADPTFWQPHLPPTTQPGRIASPAFQQPHWEYGSPLTFYMAGAGRPTPQQLMEFSGSLPGLGEQGRNIFLQAEAQSPVRTAAVRGNEFGGLPPEVALQMTSQAALIPQRIGLTGYYGGLMRDAMEFFSPELGAASDYIMGAFDEGIPDDLRRIWQENVRSGLRARGLGYGVGGAIRESDALTAMAIDRRERMLGPAIGLGTGLYEASGLGLPTSISGVAMSQLASQRREADKEASWAKAMAWATGATNLIQSGISAGLGFGGFLTPGGGKG